MRDDTKTSEDFLKPTWTELAALRWGGCGDHPGIVISEEALQPTAEALKKIWVSEPSDPYAARERAAIQGERRDALNGGADPCP